ncbi:MAG: radical SAM family heme chaperone HemW [Clostridia bacterium]|nr:radical SAM family heme chaperone HemW [Clostridia bacterium]
MALTNAKPPIGIYIHIPFCRSKCEYCDFCSFVPNNISVIEHYTDSLILQMEDWSEKCKNRRVDSVYIGGGTPTYLDPKHICRILNALYDNFKVPRSAEISIECNPATADFKSLRKLRAAGINRLSIGLQSANENELRALGRTHTFRQFCETFENARRAGFDNINVDIMYGIPEQTEKSFAYTLSEVTKLSPEHISLYALKIEDGTPFALKKDSLRLPDDDAVYEMYVNAVKYLETRGYERYEISNFAKRGSACLHNLRYWHCDEYLGLGASASSYFDGERFTTTRDIRKYIDGIEIIDSDIDIVVERDRINSAASMDEYVMLGMRLEEGVSVKDFEERFGEPFADRYGKQLDEYVEDGFVIADGESYRFTTAGMFVSNYILAGILDLGQKD